MKPIAIFRYSRTEGPGYFATFLDENRVPWQLFRIDAGDPIPRDPKLFSGLCFMGGPMSVNDPLPWVSRILKLIYSAIALDIPVIGHCLGGQLMAKALGGSVTANPVKEIGWLQIQTIDNSASKYWFGDVSDLPVFQWHGETFSIPPQATRVAGSQYCQNQIFALGKHLGMQCHIEMTSALVQSWSASGEQEIEESRGPAVQSVNEILDNLDARIATLNQLASNIYQRWLDGILSTDQATSADDEVACR